MHVASLGPGSPIAVKQVRLSGHSGEDSLRQVHQPRRSTLPTRNIDFLAEAKHLSSPVVDLAFHGALVSHDWQGYLAMERMYGSVAELGRWMHGEGPSLAVCPPRAFAPLLAAVTLRIMGDLANQLARLHEHGVVVRDIKGENVMVGADLRVKLVDFGLAREGSAPFVDRQAQGTPLTISPERRRGQPYGYDTDLFGLGCLLAQLLLGRPVRPAPPPGPPKARAGGPLRHRAEPLDAAHGPAQSASGSRSSRSTSEEQRLGDRASDRYLRDWDEARSVDLPLADFIFGELMSYSPERRPTGNQASEVAATLLRRLDLGASSGRPGRLPSAAAAEVLAEFSSIQQGIQRPYVEAVTRVPWATQRAWPHARGGEAASRAKLLRRDVTAHNPPGSEPRLSRASV